MRILILTTHLRIGGVPIYAVTLASALKRRGHEPFVASSGGELVKRLEGESIPHIWLNIDTKSELRPKIFIEACRLARFVKKNDVEMIHTNTRVTQVMGELASYLTGAAHISTCHGFFKPRLGRRLFGCWGKKVIAISDAVREHLVNDLKVRKSRIELIHNGIDMAPSKRVYSESEKRDIKKELGLNASGPVVGIIARLSSVKGHKFLIAAMREVVAQYKDAQLLIIGEGEEAAALKNQVNRSGLFESVIFKKAILDTARILAVMDIFVLSSINEGLGIAIMEALSCARPVIASDTGGIYSIIKDGATGLLVPPGDPAALAAAILRLLKDKELALMLALEGQRFVRENFSLDDMAEKVERIYGEVLKT